MKIRTTECEHEFTSKLFKKLGAFSLQGLTMSSDHRWTAAVEAIQFDDNEEVIIESVFKPNEVCAKYWLASLVKVPLYFIIYTKGTFIKYLVKAPSRTSIEYIKEEVFNEEGFIQWWKSIKGTDQTKGLNNGADERAIKTIFDSILEQNELSWGGNIDGFLFRRGRLACIIENIYTKKHALDSPEGEPSPYFFKQGPNYNTWYSSVKLAHDLSVPLFLFTIYGKDNRERIGFTIIDHLNKKGIHYKDSLTPNNNILVGLDNIVSIINSNLPTIPFIEKD